VDNYCFIKHKRCHVTKKKLTLHHTVKQLLSVVDMLDVDFMC